MKNKLIAILVLIIAAGAGYYFLFTKKKDAALTTEGLAALTPAQISALTDAQIGAITMAQKNTLTSAQIVALTLREAQIKAAKTAKDAADKKAAEQAVIDAKKALDDSIAANNTALATQQAETLRLAQLEAARIATEQDARIAAEQQIINDLKAKAAAVTVAKIKTYTQAQIDEALALDESKYFTPAQITAFDDRKIAIDKENKIAARKAELAAWTKEYIDKLTLAELRALSTDDLNYLSTLQKSYYNADLSIKTTYEAYEIAKNKFISEYNNLPQWPDKDDAYSHATAISNDLSGMNSHHMKYYDEVYDYPDAKLAYFLRLFYMPEGHFADVLRAQNWGALDSYSKNWRNDPDGMEWTPTRAGVLIDQLIKRISNLPVKMKDLPL